MITTIAPAKVNWTLEVLGRREDGYHEVRTVMQAIDICDEVSVDTSESLTIARNVEYGATDEGDLIARAARALGARVGREPSAAISVRKRIPVGAGLGGGSSDAAATLRALAVLWGIGTSAVTPHRPEGAASGAPTVGEAVAPEVGSDVAFFLRGGTALAEGRGECVTPLADAPTTWLVLLVPPLELAEKTKRMYAALDSRDFTDGSRTDTMLSHLNSVRSLADAPLYSAFERVAYEQFEGLTSFRDALVEAGARSVQLCGAGPSLFSVANGEEEARAIRARVSRVRRGEKVHVVRTLTAAESVAVWHD
jgi:4-diphosphocytidyl-2-C-methyl-D-erythritol kinase